MLPREAVKVIMRDNLTAHLFPYVLNMYELHNIRYYGTYPLRFVTFILLVGLAPLPSYRYLPIQLVSLMFLPDLCSVGE
jgi:hypothetical protein